MNSRIHFLLLLIIAHVQYLYGRQIRITGGITSKAEHNSYMAQIVFNCRHQCGGSIIHERFILTAAQCLWDVRNLDGFKSKVMQVVVGNDENLQNGTRYNIEKLIIHPDFKIQVVGHRDIALVKLQNPIQFTDKIKPVELADELPPFGQKGWVSGFGNFTESKESFKNFKIVELSILDTEKCKEIYNDVEEDMFCGEHDTKSGGVCIGDGGSPFVMNRKQVGIATGFSKCGGSHPSVFTEVPYYRDWILKQIQGR